LSLIDKIFRSRKTEFTFGHIGTLGSVLKPDSAYLNVVLLSSRVVDVRKGLSKFYGTVHSSIDFDARNTDTPTVTVTTVTTPAQLKAVDASSLDKVITLRQRLLGPVPYRGGDVHLEAGLFSVKEADLAGPFLEVLGELSATAGTSLLSAALPFAAPLVKGFNLLAGAPDSAGLEIGISETLLDKQVQEGTFVTMRAPAQTIDLTTLSLDDSNRIVGKDGAQVKDFPYFVYQISATTERDDFFKIPDLAKTHTAINDAIRNSRDQEARDLVAVFRRLAITSPDLLSQDGKRLAKLVADEVDGVIGGLTPTAAAPRSVMREMKDIPLYPPH
jgi:hypothetical protein